MFHLVLKIPREVTVAVSGGVDSMAALDFLRRGHDVTAAFFDHGTEASHQAQKFLVDYCGAEGVPLVQGSCSASKPRDESWEEYWRNQRYQFLDSLGGEVVTAHHLDDCVETYLFTSFHGCGRTIPLRRKGVIRPFLTNPKTEFLSWCQRKSVPWIEDSSNEDLAFMRNHIRHRVLPEVLRVNPGLSKVVRRMVLESVMNLSIEKK